ncbi:MAG: hypothetical protein L3I91_02335 [Mycoplasma sp.]
MKFYKFLKVASAPIALVGSAVAIAPTLSSCSLFGNPLPSCPNTFNITRIGTSRAENPDNTFFNTIGKSIDEDWTWRFPSKDEYTTKFNEMLKDGTYTDDHIKWDVLHFVCGQNESWFNGLTFPVTGNLEFARNKNQVKYKVTLTGANNQKIEFFTSNGGTAGTYEFVQIKLSASETKKVDSIINTSTYIVPINTSSLHTTDDVVTSTFVTYLSDN